MTSNLGSQKIQSMAGDDIRSSSWSWMDLVDGRIAFEQVIEAEAV
jgi:hypothetical protein